MVDFGNRVIIDSERLENQVRSFATLLRLASQTDEVARRIYDKYEGELLETGSPLLAFAAAQASSPSRTRGTPGS